MKVQIRANYKNESKIGSVRVSRIAKNKPIEYTLQLFENNRIKTTKNKFESLASAISYASLYGFFPNLWYIEEIDVKE